VESRNYNLEQSEVERVVTSESPIEWMWKRILLSRTFLEWKLQHFVSDQDDIDRRDFTYRDYYIYICAIKYEHDSIETSKIFTIVGVIKGLERTCAFDDRYDSE